MLAICSGSGGGPIYYGTILVSDGFVQKLNRYMG